ncbi:MAG: argininosuccinate lyase [Spirochaetales bacterium]|nr:argininosuccinate lyase [Spirochaetales bacterium]
MAKLWAKGYNLDSLIEAFTVGLDPVLDRRLVAADCLGSMAQARMLAAIGILTKKEADTLVKGLRDLVSINKEGKFEIQQSDEDCHTAIEGWLTEYCGEAGKKIHTGRSRNDQVLVTVRLWAKASALHICGLTLRLADRFLGFADAHRDVPMPGRTHLQTAMPSSVGVWAGAFGEELIDCAAHLLSIIKMQDQSPLGASAGFGAPLPLDRELTAKLLGFAKVQNNVQYAHNSRGKTEAMLLDAYDYIALMLSKFAQDGILFSLPEFGYFSLPKEITTGSSIMPQKKNPDGLELMRAKAASISAWSAQVKNIIRSLPSGYNRDFQDTKEPFIRGTELIELCLLMVEKTVGEMKVNRDRLVNAFTPDIYATDLAFERVLAGDSFRDAYRYVGAHLDELEMRDPQESLKKRTSSGTPGNLCLDKARKQLASLEKEAGRISGDFAGAIRGLAGADVSIYKSCV